MQQGLLLSISRSPKVIYEVKKPKHVRGGSEEAIVTQKIVEQDYDAQHGAKGFGVCPSKFLLSLV